MTPKLKEILIVSGSGSFGGLLAWLIASVNSGISANWGLALPFAILAGAAAAGGGVYVLANTDTSNLPRTVHFAVFCGISWQTIVEAGKSLANDATTHKQVATAKDSVDRIIAQAGSGGTSEQIKQIVEGTQKIAEKLPDTNDTALRSDALKTVTNAVSQIGEYSKERPEEAVAALQTIGERASASGSVAVKLTAREALMNLKEKTNNTKAWERADAAIKALR